ncbi:MAG: hypothetical protein ACPGVO_01765 [Spirulinaceae cyanobacterium]
MPTSTLTRKVYDDFIDFIATGTTPQSMIAFKLSPLAQDRLKDLIYRGKEGELNPEERAELDKFLVVEHLVRLAKAKAHLHLQN